MTLLRLLSLSVLFCMSSVCVSAEENFKPKIALSAIPAEFRYLDAMRANAEGDLNGDGIPDMAMVLTGQKGADGPDEERLFVLTGTPGGSYKILSVSGDFCHPRNFYELDVGNKSLYVRMVEYADSARESSYTLQFRYNAKLNDLELIGSETHSESYQEDVEERTSTNYLTGKAIHTTRTGKKVKTKSERVVNPAHPRLNGYSCKW